MATNGTTPELQNDADHQSAPALTADQIGWYFVEQFYTTMSKTPEKLHLFYSKNSQFVYGEEAQREPVSKGRQDIEKRIKGLNLKHAKVCVTNVDSQSTTGENIVVQAIGEMSIDNQPPRKFCQTFILAKQPSGYYVLNDMWRYIRDESEESTEEADQAVTSDAPGDAEPDVQDEAQDAAKNEHVEGADAVELDTVNQKLEAEPSAKESASVVEMPATDAPVEQAPEPVEEKTEAVAEPEKVVQELAEEEVKKPEEPKDPAPTPAVAPAAAADPTPVVAQKEVPAEPAKKLSWAKMLALSGGKAAAPTPAVAVPKAATPAVASQARPPVAAATPATQAPASNPASATEAKDQWQEAKRQSRPQPSNTPGESGLHVYVKHVGEKISDEDLKKALETFGDLSHFDINRSKNCAFAEYKTQAFFNAAIAAGTITLNGETVSVEPRRPKGAHGFPNSNRGGFPGRSRGGYEGQRNGGQGSGRGGFTGGPRARGGAPRGRGAPHAGAA